MLDAANLYLNTVLVIFSFDYDENAESKNYRIEYSVDGVIYQELSPYYAQSAAIRINDQVQTNYEKHQMTNFEKIRVVADSFSSTAPSDFKLQYLGFYREKDLCFDYTYGQSSSSTNNDN